MTNWPCFTIENKSDQNDLAAYFKKLQRETWSCFRLINIESLLHMLHRVRWVWLRIDMEA